MVLSPIRETRSPLRAKPAQEIDLELFTFIERFATSLARWDLLVYFGQHPTARDNAHEIAEHVGRNARMVQKELDDLVYLGILSAQRNGVGLRYGLTRSAATRRAIVRLARDFSTPQRAR
jgi:DNA-binding MarR family transcriptional regulator